MSKLTYGANEGLWLEGWAYTRDGVKVETDLIDTEDGPRATGLYRVTVTLVVDSVELKP